MAMELENWICDMANGDKEGLRQFYEETARSVYSFIFSVLKDPHESEDVMQETFLAVWEHAGDYVPYGKPLAWVFTIARRLCYMRLREKKRQETLEDGEIDDTGVPQPQLEQTAERTALLQALDQLNETERQIVLLYAAAGMKHREIAQVLNMPPGNGTFQIQPLCEETAENVICVIIAKNLLQACLMNRNKTSVSIAFYIVCCYNK